VKKLLAALLCASLAGCASTPEDPIHVVDEVDLPRFMGDWYVVAHIPTFIEDEAYNAIESYELNDDGTIATTFRFRNGGFDGPVKVYTPTGFVRDDPSNAVWGMQFIWPFKAEFLVVWLDEGYETTVIGRNKRDYVWIMAREPEIPEAKYRRILSFLEREGYDLSELREVPQRWPEADAAD
jgi:apolipoprotein D and lipocalin family protein